MSSSTTERAKQLAAEIHEEIAQAKSIGDDQLERNIERTRTLLQWLNEEHQQRAVMQSARTEKVGPAASDPLRTDANKLPKRDALVLTLEKIGVPSTPARISKLARKIYSVVISTSQFASFRKADERSYRKNPRNRVYIVPALSAADLSGMAGTVALSSWPIERRVVGGYSQRVAALRALCTAYDYYSKTNDTAYADIIETIGREFPSLGKHAPHFAQMAKAARADLAPIEAKDDDERKHAAERIVHLDIVSQLFGKAPLLAVGG